LLKGKEEAFPHHPNGEKEGLTPRASGERELEGGSAWPPLIGNKKPGVLTPGDVAKKEEKSSQ